MFSLSSGYPLKGLINASDPVSTGDDQVNGWLILNGPQDSVKISILTGVCKHHLMYLSKIEGGKRNP